MHLNQRIVNLRLPRPKGQGLPSARAARLSSLKSQAEGSRLTLREH
jgi:hypothetical protein